jgi:hypothetical protein
VSFLPTACHISDVYPTTNHPVSPPHPEAQNIPTVRVNLQSCTRASFILRRYGGDSEIQFQTLSVVLFCYFSTFCWTNWNSVPDTFSCIVLLFLYILLDQLKFSLRHFQLCCFVISIHSVWPIEIQSQTLPVVLFCYFYTFCWTNWGPPKSRQQSPFSCSYQVYVGPLSSVVGRGTMLQAVRLQVRVLMKQLNLFFSIYLILPAAIGPSAASV